MHFTIDFTHSPKDLWVTPWQTQVLEYTLFPSDRLLPGSHWLIFRPVSLTVTATCNCSRNKNFPIHFFPPMVAQQSLGHSGCKAKQNQTKNPKHKLYLATGADGNQTTNLSIGRWPALPPEPQLPLQMVLVCIVNFPPQSYAMVKFYISHLLKLN